VETAKVIEEKGEEKEKQIVRKKYGYIPKTVSVDQAILYTLFPLEAYWRNITYPQKVGDKIVNREGQIYPSFSDLVFPADFEVELLDSEERNKFKVHSARGYVICPLCSRTIKAHIEDEEFEIKSKIKRFFPEVGYELAITVLSSELAKRIRSHVIYKHDYRNIERVGKTKVFIMRFVSGEEIIFPTYITTYKCLEHPFSRLVGMYGVLDHIIREHAYPEKSREIREFISELNTTLSSILSLRKVPIIGAYRNTFTYTVERRGNGSGTKTLLFTKFKQWLNMKLLERKDRVDLVINLSVPRPIRMIYHYPLLSWIPHLIAYRVDRGKYMQFMIDAKKRLRKKGYSGDRIQEMIDLVTGALAYADIKPRDAFQISLEKLREIKEIAEDVGKTLRVFIARLGSKKFSNIVIS